MAAALCPSLSATDASAECVAAPRSAASAAAAGGGGGGGQGERQRRRKPPPTALLTPPVGPAEEPSAEAFDLATPQGASAGGRHFIGTPTAAGILKAFLDVEDGAADDGPPLDPDFGAAGVAAALRAQRQRVPTEDLCTPKAAPRAASLGASLLCSGEALDGSSVTSPLSESTRASPASARLQLSGSGAAEEDDEVYEDDFEAASDVSGEEVYIARQPLADERP
eukprot:TRINITY_DN6575_c0_g1_i1.p1 TRINITY_DN6575_c0_g1~~TRINITY_DN6575_c0_g1_i1.p1  ORF type:complete len:235 (+),score=68.29 TRINITY_DN6575_c0_g1_i1:34-705(+)